MESQLKYKRVDFVGIDPSEIYTMLYFIMTEIRWKACMCCVLDIQYVPWACTVLCKHRCLIYSDLSVIGTFVQSYFVYVSALKHCLLKRDLNELGVL